MAERRMFSKTIVESARFLKMPVSTQNLYFHLCMNADDDGIVEAYTVINLIKASEDDLRVLCAKGFARVLNEDLVTYIQHWREQNKIRPDRKKDSIYKSLILQVDPGVSLLEKKERSDVLKKSGPSMDSEMSAKSGPSMDSEMSAKSGPSMNSEMSAQCSAGKTSTGKVSAGECPEQAEDTHTIKYCLGNEYLTDTDYVGLVKHYSQVVVDGVIRRILEKPYRGCLNVSKISAWCAEHAADTCSPKAVHTGADHTAQLRRLAKEREV